jgi:hypothetical protein
MISSALAMLLLVVAAGKNPAAQTREGYARCLKDFVRASAEKKMDAAAFETALAAACRDKEALFKNTMVSSEVGLGVKRAVAEKGIQEEISDYRTMAKEDFQAELTLASSPQ